MNLFGFELDVCWGVDKYRKIVFTTSEEESEGEFIEEERRVTFKDDEEDEDTEEEIKNMVNTEEEKEISDRNDSIAPSLSHRYWIHFKLTFLYYY